jgi:hypothetical protein
MSKIFTVLGVAFLALLVFVGLVHGLIRLQGKDSEETLVALHRMPVIGGFFFPPALDADMKEDEIRELMAQRRLRENLELYDLPEGFSREALEGITHEMADVMQGNLTLRLELTREKEAVAVEWVELKAERASLQELAQKLLAQAEELQARQDELSQKANILADSEEKNLQVLRAIFEKMESGAAAAILMGYADLDDVAKILAGMGERQSAKVLQSLQELPGDPTTGRAGATTAVDIVRRIQALTRDTKETQ